MKTLGFICFFLAAWAGLAAAQLRSEAEGVIFYDQAGLKSREFATPIEFRYIEKSSQIWEVTTADSQKLRLIYRNIMGVVDYPNLQQDYTSKFQFDQLRQLQGQLKEMAGQYAKGADLLESISRDVDAFLAQADTGKVFKQGAWVAESAPMESPVASAAGTITTVSGKKFTGASIKEAGPDGVVIYHSGGVAKVPVSDVSEADLEKSGYDAKELLAQAEEARAAAEAAAAAMTPAVAMTSPDGGAPSTGAMPAGRASDSPPDSPNLPEGPWRPQSLSDVATCALIIDTTLKDGEGSGTGFLCNHGGATFIYTNIHVIDQAVTLKIRDSAGRFYEDVEYVEVVNSATGEFQRPDGRLFGGDIARLKLKTYRPNALTLAPPGQKMSKGTRLGVVGNSGGRGEITERTGELSTDRGQTFVHSAPGESGNSGSPVVDLEKFEVYGIHTWGVPLPLDPVTARWVKDDSEVPMGESIHFAPWLNAEIEWLRMTLPQFLEMGRKLETLESNVYALALMDAIVPTTDGLFVDPRQIVRGDYTVEMILDAFSGNPVINQLIQLHVQLARNRESKLRISNHEVWTRYLKVMENCLSLVTSHRRELGIVSWPYYHRLEIEAHKTPHLCLAYEQVLYTAARYYEDSLSVGGKIPLGGRPRLPSLDADSEMIRSTARE